MRACPAEKQPAAAVPQRQAKLLLFISCLFFADAAVFAGALSGYGNLSVIETQYFDIIYPPQSERTALLLARHADALFEKASRETGGTKMFRMPVVITPESDQLNAYFTIVPYNRIVLYDTAPDNQLDVYENTVLSVFYHELVHAVVSNIRPPFLQGLAAVFGDIIAPSIAYNLPTSLAEGAAVALESADGTGRLNDGFSMHPLRQAKIEGQFPDYHDASGSRDTYPSGTIPYIFGGAFTQWLQQTYGMDTYRTFIQKNGNFYLVLGTKTLFKQVYGITADEAWALFERSLVIPEIPADPEEHSGVSALPLKNAGQRFPLSLADSSAGAVWIDGYNGNIWFLPKTADARPQKLFSCTGADKLRTSADGSLLAVSAVRTEAHPAGAVTGKRYAVLYDMRKRRFLPVPKTRMQEAVPAGGNTLLVAAEHKGQKMVLAVYPLGERPAQPLTEIGFPSGAVISSLTDIGGNRTAFLLKYRKDTYICIADLGSGNYTAYPAPQYDSLPLSLRHLSLISDKDGTLILAFSWAAANTLPRLGMFTAASGQGIWRLMDSDLSGGIYTPAAAGPGTIYYTAQFYQKNTLMALSLDSVSFSEYTAGESRIGTEETEIGDGSGTFHIKKYNPFKYAAQGILIPIGTIPVYDYNFNTVSMGWIGATWITMDPGEKVLIQAAAGGDPATRTGGFRLSLAGGKPYFAFGLNGSLLFSQAGYEQSCLQLVLSSSFRAGRTGTFSISNEADWFAGRIPGQLVYAPFANTGIRQKTPLIEHTFRNYLTVAYSTIRRRTGDYHALGGIRLSAFMLTAYNSRRDIVLGNIGAEITAALPYTLPFRNPDNITLNQPLIIQAALFPDMEKAFETAVQTVLVSAEIQKTLAHLPVYAQRITVTLGYRGWLSYTMSAWDILKLPAIFTADRGNMPYYDCISLAAAMTMSFNTGFLTGIKAEIGAELIWNIRYGNGEPPFKAAVIFRVNP